MLSRLSDMNFVQDLCEDLYELFKVRTGAQVCPQGAAEEHVAYSGCIYFFLPQTDKGFDKTMFERQMSVMRGQVSVIFIPFVCCLSGVLAFSCLYCLFCYAINTYFKNLCLLVFPSCV